MPVCCAHEAKLDNGGASISKQFQVFSDFHSKMKYYLAISAPMCVVLHIVVSVCFVHMNAAKESVFKCDSTRFCVIRRKKDCVCRGFGCSWGSEVFHSCSYTYTVVSIILLVRKSKKTTKYVLASLHALKLKGLTVVEHVYNVGFSRTALDIYLLKCAMKKAYNTTSQFLLYSQMQLLAISVSCLRSKFCIVRKRGSNSH